MNLSFRHGVICRGDHGQFYVRVSLRGRRGPQRRSRSFSPLLLHRAPLPALVTGEYAPRELHRRLATHRIMYLDTIEHRQ